MIRREFLYSVQPFNRPTLRKVGQNRFIMHKAARAVAEELDT
jgi:hypothetical protein